MNMLSKTVCYKPIIHYHSSSDQIKLISMHVSNKHIQTKQEGIQDHTTNKYTPSH